MKKRNRDRKFRTVPASTKSKTLNFPITRSCNITTDGCCQSLEMAEDSGKLVSEETRRALSDVTNLPSKRGISSIFGDLLHKSEDESGKTHEDSRVKFSKRLCLVVDDLVNENVRPIGKKEGSSSDDKNSSGDFHDKECGESHIDVVEISSGDEKEKPLKEIYFEPGDRDGARELNANQTGVTTSEGLALSVLSSNFESRNPMVAEEELRNCQNLRSFEMKRCSNEKKKEHVNMGDDLLRSCSCNFCVKAAYIWSDLHYQDIKGRLSALKKSQKEASNLIQRNDKERPSDFHASVSSSKLESELMGQWRSLFVNMGEILANESNNLQNSFVKMKELREECRMDVERSLKTPSK